MPSPATTWLHVSGYRFLLRRIECALLFGDVCAATGALRARTTSLALGCVLAIVAAMGCAFVALLRPQSALGQAPIVMGRESGALYVRVDDVWHPVLNLASARLIAATNANPQPVSESELGHTKRGPLLGIPGAPQLLDQPLAGAESAWAICDSDNGGSTTVVVGPAEDSSAQVLTAEQMILVATESGSPTYLLYGGRRAVVDLADPAVVWALRLQGRVPHVVAQSLLNAVPEAPRITAPRIRGGGRASAAGNHLGQPSMARNAGVDDRDPLAGAAGESPDLVEVGELSGPLSPAESPSRFGGDLGAYLTLYGRPRRRRQRRFG